MNLSRIIADLHAELEDIEKAINAFERLAQSSQGGRKRHRQRSSQAGGGERSESAATGCDR